MTHISPFDFLVNVAIVRAAARRAELLDLPRRRSPKFDLSRRDRMAEVKSAEDLELDAILDEMEVGMEADVDVLLSRLETADDGEAYFDDEALAGVEEDKEPAEHCLGLEDMAYDAGDSPLLTSMTATSGMGKWPEHRAA